MRSPLGKLIVAGKFVRVLYAVAKASAFAGLALQKPFPALLPEIWSRTDWFFVGSTYFFVYLSVVLCIARGLPVIAEFVYAQKSDILRRPGKRQ
jgi:CDP-diacylglycerol--glycerol-3-phosphate 3-phosphatidyltransferase